METMDIVLIILACVAGIAILAALLKKKSPGPVPRPGASVSVKTAAKPPVTSKPVTTASKTPVSATVKTTVPPKKPDTVPTPKTPAPETVILFSAVPVRRVRKCLGCDGENKMDAKLCSVCGRRL